jgi:aspartyl-tRNA(Asn)/glutamyl-tRNA(Gln) amidotransferase subunit C
MAEKYEEIVRSAEEIVKSFVEAVKDLPEVKETYFPQENFNIVREDAAPAAYEEQAKFRKRFLSNAPASDDQGNLLVEVAGWAGER